MAKTLDEAFLTLTDNWVSTNEINNLLRQSWSTTYGQLSRLVADGRAECVEIKTGKKNSVGWRKKTVKEIVG